MKKKLINIFVMSALISQTIFANDVQQNLENNTFEDEQYEDFYLSYNSFNTVSNEIYEINNEIEEITFEEALEKALKYNDDIAQYERDIKDLEFQKQKLKEANYTNYSSYISNESQLMKINDNLDLYDQTIRAYKNGVEYDLLKLIIDIEKIKNDIEEQQQTIVVNEILLNNDTVKYEAGYLTELDLNKTKSQYNNSITNLNTLFSDLEEEQKNLNEMLGYDDDIDVFVQYTYEMDNYEVNIDIYANSMAKNTISAKSQLSEIEALEFEEEYYYADGQTYYYEEKDEMSRNISSKKYNYNNYISSTKDSITQNYNNLLKLEENQELLLESYFDTVTEYENILYNYENGYAILLQLEQQYLNIIKSVNDIEENIYEHSNLKYSIQYPDLK